MKPRKTINHYLKYDHLYKNHYGKYIQAYRPKREEDLEDYLVDLIKPQSEESILDCGCGFGAVAELLSSKCDTITGLNICRSQFPLSPSKVLYIEGDFDNISNLFNHNTFDKIIFIETMGYTIDLATLIAQCRRVLKKKGKLIIKDFFLKKMSNQKLLKLQKEQHDLVQDFYNYKIIDHDLILKELRLHSMKVLKNKTPNFYCDWGAAFSFEQKFLPSKLKRIMRRHTPKDNLFTCLEIISEKT